MSDDRDLVAVGCALVLIMAFLGFFAIASVIWEFRNPLANASTCFTHFSDVIHFRKLPEFQPRTP